MTGKIIDLKRKRAAIVNDLIRTIGSTGRRFFYYKKKNQFAKIEVDDRGRVWWVDEYTEKRIYLHYKKWESGFSNGGTLRALVNAFRDFVSKNKPVNPNYFGPWPEWYCQGDLWGYGEDMLIVRDAAKALVVTEG